MTTKGASLENPVASERRRLCVLGLVLIAVAVVAVTGAIFVAHEVGGGVSGAEIERFIKSWGTAGAVASIFLMAVHAFIPFPAEFVAFANGMLFGVLWGTALTWLGAMLGAVLSFGLARRYGQPLLRGAVATHRWEAMRDWIGRRGTVALLGARLLPILSFNLVNMAAGFAGVGWWTFLWTTGVGILPMTVAMALLGAGVLQASPWMIAAALAAMVGVGIGALAWRRRSAVTPGGGSWAAGR